MDKDSKKWSVRNEMWGVRDERKKNKNFRVT